MKDKPIFLQLTLIVKYIPNGTTTEALISYLQHLPGVANDEGLFTGNTEAEAEVHEYSVKTFA